MMIKELPDDSYRATLFYNTYNPATRIVSRAIMISSFVGITKTFTGEYGKL